MPSPTATQSFPGPELLTLQEAASIANKSVSWVWTRRRFRSLRPAMLNGRQAVTAESLFQLLGERAQQRKPPALRLIVNNDQ